MSQRLGGRGELRGGELILFGHVLQGRDGLGIGDGAGKPPAAPGMGQELVAPPRRGDVDQEVEGSGELALGVEQRRRIGLEGDPAAIKERRSIRGVTAIAERPDGRRVAFQPYPTPLFDADGEFTGALNLLVDISAARLRLVCRCRSSPLRRRALRRG